ncbi:MAG: oligosaccharide flippase family protein [Bacilli bacterium]|nr:oligosaccharide flippase family protein [Bacilli bacterium]
MNNSSKNKYLLKNTIVLSIGNFGSKLISFFLVPLYTNIFTTAEYGTIDLITILTTVIVPLITLNISESVMRYSMDKNSDKDKILSVGNVILLVSILICMISFPILSVISYTSQYALLLVIYMMTFISSSIYLCFIRGKEQLFDYSIISIVQTLIIAILNIYFLIVLKIGIKGYIIAYIIAYLITTFLCIIRGKIIPSFKKLSLDKKLAKDMIKYSVILIPNSLMWWIMNSLDRIMVTSMISIEANGVYTVSYKLPTIIITLTSIFNQAWMFSAVKEKDSADKETYSNSIFTALFNIVITISLFLLLILKPLMKIYVGKAFFLAWEYTPALIIGTVFLTLGTFISNEYTAHKDSIGFLKSSTIGALINLILNFLLIPIIGVMGAAIATCISYICVYIFRIFDTRKYLKYRVLDKEKVICISLLLLSSIVIYIDNYFCYLILLLILLIDLIISRKFWFKILNNIKRKIFKKKVRA